MSLIRECRICGQRVSFRKMPHGKYVCFDVKTNNKHMHSKSEVNKFKKIEDKNQKAIEIKNDDKETLQALHMMIKKVSNNLDQLQFNTCVSEFMIFTNHIQKLETINKDIVRSFIILINPFMPHLAQELWELTGESSELTFEEWPTYDKELIISDEIIIPIQINGKRKMWLI